MTLQPDSIRTLFENVPVGIFQATLSGRLVDINEEMVRIFGYSSKAEMLSSAIIVATDFFTREDDFEKPSLDKVDLDEVSTCVGTARRKDGSQIELRITFRKYMFDTKVEPTIIGVVEDTSAHSQLRSAPRRDDNTLLSIINSLPFDLFVKDYNGRVILQNRVSLECWGDLNALDKQDLEINKSDEWEQRRQSVEEGQTIDFESQIVNPSQRRLHVRRIVTPFHVDEEGFGGAIFLNIDISEQKRLQQQLDYHMANLEQLVKQRTAQVQLLNESLTASNVELLRLNEQLSVQKTELELLVEEVQNTQKQLIFSEKMASIGVLTSGIAHEINNPINFINSGVVGLEMEINDILAAIREFTTRVKEVCPHHDTRFMVEIADKYKVQSAMENIPKLIRSINTGIERTITIVNGLRTFLRLDDENKSLASLREIIGSALTILHNSYKQNISVNLDFCPNDTIMCFPGKLGQVFLNLFMNSIQAIESSGTISVATHFNERSNRYCISIKDSGIGIPSAIQQKIFDPFFTTKPVGEGTGLGLSIVHGIINDHNGKILVNSEAGKGAEFLIYLPKK